MKKYFLIFSFIVVSLCWTNTLIAQNCDASLSVEKDRSYKAVTENGAMFTLILKNTSSRNQNFSIDISSLDTSCDNGTNKSRKVNSKLDFLLMDNFNKSLRDNNLSVAAGNVVKFKIKVTAPTNTAYNTWGCLQVTASNNQCRSNINQVVLSGLVTDPSEN